MRTIRTKVYKFNELNEDAKQKAIHDLIRTEMTQNEIARMYPTEYAWLCNKRRRILDKCIWHFHPDGTIFNLG